MAGAADRTEVSSSDGKGEIQDNKHADEPEAIKKQLADLQKKLSGMS